MIFYHTTDTAVVSFVFSSLLISFLMSFLMRIINELTIYHNIWFRLDFIIGQLIVEYAKSYLCNEFIFCR
jgi:hypothetical protein